MGAASRAVMKPGRPQTTPNLTPSPSFHVVNHRQDLHFVYLRFQNDTDVSTAPPCAFCWGAASIVASAKLKITDSLKNGPHQLRISLLPNDKRM